METRKGNKSATHGQSGSWNKKAEYELLNREKGQQAN